MRAEQARNSQPRAVHEASDRQGRRFVAINCGALPDNLVESELFGYVRGAFTGAAATKRGLFEEAQDGTIFLDEIGELPLSAQVKLTRVLQQHAVRRIGSPDEQPVNARVIAATNVDLQRAVSDGKFREDLYYRLNVFPIHLPPLRERRDDVPVLAALFLDRIHTERKSAPEGFTPDALAALIAHDWPGKSGSSKTRSSGQRRSATRRALISSLFPRMFEVVREDGSREQASLTFPTNRRSDSRAIARRASTSSRF